LQRFIPFTRMTVGLLRRRDQIDNFETLAGVVPELWRGCEVTAKGHSLPVNGTAMGQVFEAEGKGVLIFYLDETK
jgi:hypothetical protein